MASCPATETLERLLDGTLPGPDTEQVFAHVEACATCQEMLNRLSDDTELAGWNSSAALAPESQVEPELARLLDRLRASPAFVGENLPQRPLSFLGPPQADDGLGTLESYVVHAELGRGGMGIVLRGYDEALQRTVALKVLRPELAHERARARFLREGRAAARVKHDHVVSVYAVVNPADGPPFLVMEYLAGPSLAQLIRSRQRLEPRQAATLAAQVADGLVAAHAAGLTHRDIKPANIMLEFPPGATGTSRVKIMDFGLARLAALPSSVTLEGAVVGTPAYMSPEQARGEDCLDPRTDIYSLGVTLYEMLTGDVPFRGAPHIVLRQVIESEPAPPRRLNDAIPSDLETICLKAMAKEPRRRYQTAQAVADDLRRWLTGEPVVARPAGRIERSWRWCRRKPVVAALTAALTLVLALGFGGVTWQWQRAEGKVRELKREHLQALANLAQARETFHQALEVLNKISQRSFAELASRPGLQTLRRMLLHQVVEDHRKLLDHWPEDAHLQGRLGRCLLELGVTTGQTGKLADALEAHRQSRALLEKAYPDGDRATGWIPNGLAANDLYIGWLLYQMGRFDEALDSLGRARHTWNEIVEEHPNEHWFRRNQSICDCTIAEVLLALEQPDEALESLKEARAIAERLVNEQPGDDRYPEHLAYVDYWLGTLHHSCGRWSEAVESLQQAYSPQQKLLRATPADIWRQRSLARIDHALGLVYLAKEQPDQARAHLERARTVFQKLCRDDAEVTDFQRRLASTQLALGQLHRLRGEWPESRRCFTDSRDRHGRLLRDNPQMVLSRMEAVESYIGLSRVEQQTGQLDLALHDCEGAEGHLRQLSLAPERAAPQHLRGEILSCFAQVWWQQGRRARALAASQGAVAAAQNAVSKAPQQVWFRQAARDHATWLAALQQ
jgi:tetratricopeptide (TPR) repeat protein/tRNA A-37 threonylcarbamoyl transferase component Bud32